MSEPLPNGFVAKPSGPVEGVELPTQHSTVPEALMNSCSPGVTVTKDGSVPPPPVLAGGAPRPAAKISSVPSTVRLAACAAWPAMASVAPIAIAAMI